MMNCEIYFSQWDNDANLVSLYIDEFLFPAPRTWSLRSIVHRYYERWAANELFARIIDTAPCPVDLVVLDFMHEMSNKREEATCHMVELYETAIDVAERILTYLKEG